MKAGSFISVFPVPSVGSGNGLFFPQNGVVEISCLEGQESWNPHWALKSIWPWPPFPFLASSEEGSGSLPYSYILCFRF